MQKSSLISLFALVLGLFLIFIFVVPAWNKIDALNNEKTSKEKQLADLHSSVSNIDELSAKYKKSNKDLDKLSLAIPSEQQIPELFIQLDDMIKSNGMTVNNIEFTDEGASGGGKSSQLGDAKIIRIKLAIEGGYSNFKNLLNDIEHDVRLMDVSAMSFSRGGTENVNNMKFEVVLETYYLPSK